MAVRAVAPTGSENSDRRKTRANDSRRRMEFQNSIDQPVRGDGSQVVRHERLNIGGMICVQPYPLDPRYVRQPRHRLRIFVPLDEVRKVPPVIEQKWRARWSGTHIEARHRAEEI